MSLELLSLTNPVFKSYTFWAGVLVIKMLAMSLLTAVQRFKTKVRATREHLSGNGTGGLCLGLGQSPVSWVKAKAPKDCRHSRSACIMTQHVYFFFMLSLLLFIPDFRQSGGSDVAETEGQIR